MAVGNDYKNAMKKAVGLTADYFDDEIVALVEEARSEMKRIGLAEAIVNDETDYTIRRAIRTYIQSEKATKDTDAIRLLESFNNQIDVLIKSTGYRRA